MALARAGGIGVHQRQARQAPARAQHEIAGNALGGRERQDRFGIRVIAERRRKAGIDARAGEIDGDIESVAGTADAEAAVAAAHEFDDCFPDRDYAVSLFAHDRRIIARTQRQRNRQRHRVAATPSTRWCPATMDWTGTDVTI